jgi:nitronate monooxygenase
VTRFSPSSLKHPIVLAPMGGGPATPALTAAVSGAGGLGFLAAGYKTAGAVRTDVEAVRELTDAPFGVNVFAPPGPVGDPAALERFAQALGSEADRYGTPLGAPRHDDDDWQAKLALMRELRVPVVSFTFGCPPRGDIHDLQAAGCAVWVTVTRPEEAAAAAEAGADALVVQGTEAGGHRASYDDNAPGDIGLLALLQLVQAVTDAPLIATGGIATGRGVAAVLAAGAAAAQVGTAFMLCPEAATAPAHKDAIAASGDTALTRAFTGRTARGIVNRWLREHHDAPSAYPDIHYVTAKVRAAARGRDDPGGFNLWAGQAHTLAEPVPAAELVRRLSDEAHKALRAAADR